MTAGNIAGIVSYMEIVSNTQPGVIFYAVREEDYVKLANLQRALEAESIEAVWSQRTWKDEKVPSLNVYANPNRVADIMRGVFQAA